MPVETTRSYGVSDRAAAVRAPAVDAAARAGPTCGGEEVEGAGPEEGCPGQRDLTGGGGRERPGHRVPFDRDRGGYEDACRTYGRRGQESFLSVKDHRPLTVVSPSLMETSVELPLAPYCALKNTLPGIVRYVFLLESVSG